MARQFVAPLVVILCGLAGASVRADSADELKKLQGVWQVTKGALNGRDVAREVADDSRIVVDGAIMWFESSRDRNSARISVDAAAAPKSLDAEVLDGADQGKKRLALYELAGDVLKICWTRGEQRPAKLEGGEGIIYLELRRAE